MSFRGTLTLLVFVAAVSANAAASAQGTTTPVSAPLPTVQQAVANVQGFYDHTQTFQSDFDQTFLAKAYNQTTRSTGHVAISKPGKMNWVYVDPKGNRVVSDGTTLWIHDAKNDQTIKQPVTKASLPSALSFLTGQGNLANDYTFTMLTGAQANFPGGYVLVGTPKVPNPAVTSVVFYVDQATSQVRRGMFIDGQGNRNSFEFKNPKVNLPVAPGQFVVPP